MLLGRTSFHSIPQACQNLSNCRLDVKRATWNGEIPPDSPKVHCGTLRQIVNSGFNSGIWPQI